MMSPQEVFEERVTFLKEKISPKNKSEVNDTFRLQIHALRSADIEKVESIILQKMALLKNYNKQQNITCRYCYICGKKLKFAGTNENPLSCWQCMIVNVDS